MIPLPIDPLLPEILDRVRESRRLVLVAPPGAGKTTRVPAAILRSRVLTATHPALVLLQPRRVAAQAVAGRIAEENGWTLGGEVGYQIRFERRMGPATNLRVVTEGILNRQLIADPFLEGVGAVVLDEFHERSLHTDLALALLREVQESVRPDLLIVVMSATMEAEPVSRFLGNAPVVTVDGRTYPVAIAYRPRVRPASSEAIAEAVGEVLDGGEPTGDILVFLPGAEEIRRAGAALRAIAGRHDALVVPLHGGLPGDEQRWALQPADRRRVILSTNLAETSLTIEGVRTVIDSGLARFAEFDPGRGLDRLVLGRISVASATQRAGRAGRTAPGRCVRLWSEGEQRGRDATDVPEIHRVDLCGTVLALHGWGHTDPRRFPWFDPPAEDRLAAAERLLAMLGAVEGEGGRITPLGRTLLSLPVHPRLGRLLIAAAGDGDLKTGATLAALLSEKDIVAAGSPGPGPAVSGRGTSDLLTRLDLVAAWGRNRRVMGGRESGVDPGTLRRVLQVRDDLIRHGRRLLKFKGENHDAGDLDAEAVLRWVLLAYPDRVCRRRGGERTGLMVGGRGVRLAPESVVLDADLFVALDPREERRGETLEARVRIASALNPEWLDEFFPGAIRREMSIRYDEGRRRVIGVNTLWYHDLMLREDRSATIGADEAGRALAEAVRPEAAAIVRARDGVATWLARIDLLARAMPEADWPDFGEDRLADLLAEACEGRRGLDEVEQVALVPLLRGKLTHAQRRLLDDEAPEGLVVPSGNRIRLAYEPGRPPVLAARLQELFGWRETPRVAAGRVAVLLHLLGPNGRPVQVTDDLASFWSTTYFRVRKDLRARYPKHSWPDDPLHARAEAKGGRRQ